MPITRRDFLNKGAAGMGALFLPELSRAQGAAATRQESSRTNNILRDQPADVAKRARMNPAGVDRVAAHFTSLIESGAFHGAQLAVCRNGEPVIELAGGAGVAGKPVRFDSLLCLLSATKALTAMAMHTLHDRGVFEYTDRVAKHWPEFARNGKDEITIAQVMSHRAGLVKDAYSGYLQWREWAKPGGVAKLIEAWEPQWPPGAANGYHALTYGQVLDELIKRWTKKNTGEWLRAEICAPLKIDDVYIGLPDRVWPRYAGFAAAPARARSPGMTPPPGGEDHFFNSQEIMRQCLAWGSGAARARDVARLMNVYAFEGGYGGKKFFSKETFNRAVTPTNQPEDVDRILRRKVRWGLGLHVGVTEGTPQAPGSLFGKTAGPRACGHMGGNSALVWADPDLRLSVAFISTGAKGLANYEPLSDLIRGACQ